MRGARPRVYAVVATKELRTAKNCSLSRTHTRHCRVSLTWPRKYGQAETEVTQAALGAKSRRYVNGEGVFIPNSLFVIDTCRGARGRALSVVYVTLGAAVGGGGEKHHWLLLAVAHLLRPLPLHFLNPGEEVVQVLAA